MRRKKIALFDVGSLYSRECAQLLEDCLLMAQRREIDGVVLESWTSRGNEVSVWMAGQPRHHADERKRGADRLIDALRWSEE